MLRRLEKLSMLEISDDKRENMIRELAKIVGFVDNLGELDTEALEPTFNVLQNGTPMREDVPRSERAVTDAVLSRAPKSDRDYFIVPNIIE